MKASTGDMLIKGLRIIATSFLVICALSLSIAPIVARAGEDTDEEPNGPAALFEETAGAAGFQTGEQADLTVLIGSIIYGILGLVGVIFLVLMIYGGFLWMTGAKGGEKGEIQKAKGVLKNAIIGIVIVLAAYAITYFIVNLLATTTLRE